MTTIANLEQKHLFKLTRKHLEKRVITHCQDNSSIAYVVQCAVAILVRNAFTPLDFSYLAKDQICSLFLERSPEELSPVRHLCVYFQAYFSKEDWNKVIQRLFKNKKEFLAVTKETRSRTDHLHAMLHSGTREPKELVDIATLFKDANGKKHRFTFKNADPCYSVQEINDLLAILGTLTIFQKDGVQRFAEIVRYIYVPTTPVYDAEKKTEEVNDWQETLYAQLIKALEVISHVKVNDKPGAGLLIESPKFIKTNCYARKTPEEVAKHLFDGFAFDPSIDQNVLMSRMLTALVSGLKLKDAKPMIEYHGELEEPAGSLQEIPKENSMSQNKTSKPKTPPKSQHGYYNKEKAAKIREQKQQERLVRKATGKKKKGKRKKR
ncbi:hypothetical protein [Enterococcus sp. AZ109]|uniref:hypothetical protein n=1 Tax=Enterococcus sp. AZ109 TaxID=2774634 RepID=UPI003F23F65C